MTYFPVQIGIQLLWHWEKMIKWVSKVNRYPLLWIAFKSFVIDSEEKLKFSVEHVLYEWGNEGKSMDNWRYVYIKVSKGKLYFLWSDYGHSKVEFFIFSFFEPEKRQRLVLFCLFGISQLYLQQLVCLSLQQIY